MSSMIMLLISDLFEHEMIPGTRGTTQRPTDLLFTSFGVNFDESVVLRGKSKILLRAVV